MSTTFDDVLLPINYSATATGGPEWATNVQRSGLGGAIATRNQNRADYISRYQIAFEERTAAELAELRAFGILRRGMARGFRFLAPDDSRLTNEVVGRYNSSTGEIERLATTNGTESKFYIVKQFKDATGSYLRWLVKPSPLDVLTVSVYQSDGTTLITSADFASGLSPNGNMPIGREVTVSGYGTATIYYGLGILKFASAPSIGKVIKVTGRFHLPVAFESDWAKFDIDVPAISQFAIGVAEILPAELAISPLMTLPSLPDETIPSTPVLTYASRTATSITCTFPECTDNSGVPPTYQKSVNGGAWTSVSTTGTTTRTVVFSGLSPETAYDLQLRAIDGSGNTSSPSNTITQTTNAYSPFTNGPSVTRATVGTSASIDTSGMDLLVAVVSGYDISGTISDSKSNTWTALTNYNGSGSNHVKIFYCKNPTVGTGHTFTLGAAAYASMVVASFAGAHLTSPFDQENGNHSASGTTVQAGSITPTVNNTLIIAGIELGGSNYSSIDSGFTLVAKEDFAYGVNIGTAMAYKVQSTAAAINPQWTISASASSTAAIANFKPA